MHMLSFLFGGVLASFLISLGFYFLGIKRDLKRVMDIPSMLMLLEMYKPLKMNILQFRVDRTDKEIFQRPSFLLQNSMHNKYFLVSFDFNKRVFNINEVISFKTLDDGRKVPENISKLTVINNFNDMVDLLDK